MDKFYELFIYNHEYNVKLVERWTSIQKIVCQFDDFDEYIDGHGISYDV